MALSFDAEFSINGDTSPTPSGGSEWNSYNVMYQIVLRDKNGNALGGNRYTAETTTWYTDYHDDSIINSSIFYPNGLQHYEYNIANFASGLGIDTNEIDAVSLSFLGYSPIAPSASSAYNDSITMVVRFDNVATSYPAPVPEPASILLLGTGLVVVWLGGTRFRRKNKEGCRL